MIVYACIQVIRMKKGQRTRSFRVADNLKPVAKSLKFNKPSYTVGSLSKTERMKNAVVEQVIKVKLLMDNACIITIIVFFFHIKDVKKEVRNLSTKKSIFRVPKHFSPPQLS